MTTVREWCVMHPDHPEAPHRGPMAEAAARRWVKEIETDSGRVGLFFVASRRVGPWLAADEPAVEHRQYDELMAEMKRNITAARKQRRS